MNDRQLAYRVRILPEQLARARARVRGLEAEAQRLGMHDLLETSSPAISTAGEGAAGAALPLAHPAAPRSFWLSPHAAERNQ